MSGTAKFICTCGEKYSGPRIDKERVLTTTKRKTIPRELRVSLLEKQGNKCIYCDNPFGTLYYKNYKISKLTVHADHQTPFSYLQSNPDNNWVLACNVCNHWKYNKTFEDIESCRNYLIYKWERAIGLGNIELLSKS